MHENHEIDTLHISKLPRVVARLGIGWLHPPRVRPPRKGCASTLTVRTTSATPPR